MLMCMTACCVVNASWCDLNAAVLYSTPQAGCMQLSNAVMKFGQLRCGCAGAAGGYDGYFKHSAAAAASAASSSGKACCTVCHQLQLQSLAVTYVQSQIQSNVHHAVQCLTATCLELACVRAALRLLYCELNV